MPNPLKSLVVNTNFVSWPKHMAPGHCFVWYKPPENLTFYSMVRATPTPLLKAGFRRTRTFGPPYPTGEEAYVPQDVAVLLLSAEQMELARRLGWPQDELTLRRIFSLPSN
jgi:hypothetical protein